MLKIVPIKNLDCAHCGAKMEQAIAKLPGVNKAIVNFMTQKLVLDVEPHCSAEALAQAQKICSKISPDCKLVF